MYFTHASHRWGEGDLKGSLRPSSNHPIGDVRRRPPRSAIYHHGTRFPDPSQFASTNACPWRAGRTSPTLPYPLPPPSPLPQGCTYWYRPYRYRSTSTTGTCNPVHQYHRYMQPMQPHTLNPQPIPPPPQADACRPKAPHARHIQSPKPTPALHPGRLFSPRRKNSLHTIYAGLHVGYAAQSDRAPGLK